MLEANKVSLVYPFHRVTDEARCVHTRSGGAAVVNPRVGDEGFSSVVRLGSCTGHSQRRDPREGLGRDLPIAETLVYFLQFGVDTNKIFNFPLSNFTDKRTFISLICQEGRGDDGGAEKKVKQGVLRSKHNYRFLIETKLEPRTRPRYC